MAERAERGATLAMSKAIPEERSLEQMKRDAEALGGDEYNSIARIAIEAEEREKAAAAAAPRSISPTPQKPGNGGDGPQHISSAIPGALEGFGAAVEGPSQEKPACPPARARRSKGPQFGKLFPGLVESPEYQALRRRDLLIVSVLIANRDDKAGGESCPGREKIASVTGFSPRTVDSGISALIEAGIIRQVRSGRWKNVASFLVAENGDEIARNRRERARK